MSRVLSIIKEFGNSRRNSPWLKITVPVILALVLMMGMLFTSYSENVNEGLADNLIRLHVIANSDSADDQALKRNVRDVILEYMKGTLKDSKNVDQTKNIIKQDLSKIEELSRNEIAKENSNYSVKAMLGSYPFPTKTYGDITLPAGNYQALRVVIGKGEGANWWCVLFPPLCFVDATHGTVPDSVKQELKATLTDDEYNIISSSQSDEDIPVKVKFKVVEFFQSSKIKFSGMINRIFK